MDYQDRLAGLGHSYFTNRAQIDLVEMLFKKINLGKDVSILSVGCGDGNELKVLHKYGSVDIIDINKRTIDLIPKGLYSTAFVEDICNFGPKEEYDVVVGFEVLEHIADDKKALDNIYKSLKPGGYFLFTVPAHPILFSAHDKALKHFRRYNKKMLKQIINGKFRILFLSYRYFFLFLPVMISKLINKNTKPKIEAPKFSATINEILFLLLRAEIAVMEWGISLPVGISLVGVCRRI